MNYNFDRNYAARHPIHHWYNVKFYANAETDAMCKQTFKWFVLFLDILETLLRSSDAIFFFKLLPPLKYIFIVLEYHILNYF